MTATDAPSGSGVITLASVLGPDAIPSNVVVNERTTVATAYAMTQFAMATRVRALARTSERDRNGP